MKRYYTRRLSRFAPPKRASRIFNGETLKQLPFRDDAENALDLPDHPRFAIPRGRPLPQRSLPDWLTCQSPQNAARSRHATQKRGLHATTGRGVVKQAVAAQYQSLSLKIQQ